MSSTDAVGGSPPAVPDAASVHRFDRQTFPLNARGTVEDQLEESRLPRDDAAHCLPVVGLWCSADLVSFVYANLHSSLAEWWMLVINGRH